ncbi:MAG: hypothetical protein WED10_04875 [Brumimicrobium sp.]
MIKIKHSFFVVLMAFAAPIFSQDVVSVDYLMESEVRQVNVYDVDDSDTNLLFIPFDYSSSKTETTDLFDSLASSSCPIEKIDFVYTQYKVSEDFDQANLNRKRLEVLRKHAPFIFDNNVIDWHFYEQINNLSLEENKKLFHGFVIHYLHNSAYAGNNGPMSTEDEIKAIENYLDSVRISSSKRVVDKITECETRYSPILRRKREKGIYYSKKFFGIWRKELPATYDTTWSESIIPGSYTPFGTDTVVIKTLRSYEDKWNCNYVVEDVTGSMYPYIAQTLAWKKLKMDSSVLEHFVFFNDGDNRPDGPIGKSGGAYYIQSHDFEEIGNKSKQVMRKGFGGGAPENNIEATLFAGKKFKESETFILIADNYAPIRDMSISDKVEKPTHIILCGVRNGKIHHSYIKLALQTGGSIHTIEEDIDDVQQLKAGDTFEMGGQKWKYLSRGHIVLIK